MKKEEKEQLIDELINEVTSNFECAEHIETYIDEENEDLQKLNLILMNILQGLNFLKVVWLI